MLDFEDSVSVHSTREKTPEGFLRAQVRFGRTGILEYAPTDPVALQLRNSMPAELRDLSRPYRLFRPATENGSKSFLDSIKGKPITSNHPTEKVTSTNYRRVIVGAVGSQPFVDGDFAAGDVTFYDSDVIRDIENGVVELSLGYATEVEWTPGNPEYDGVQRNLRANHLALVRRGRAGREVRVLDGDPEERNMAKRKIAGVEIEVSDAAVEAVDAYLSGVEQRIADSASTAKRVEELSGEVAALKKTIAERDARIAEVSDSANLDKRVAERAKLVADAKRVAPEFVCDGLSDDKIVEGAIAKRGLELTGDAARGAFAAFVAAAPESGGAARRAGEALANDSAPEEDPYHKARREAREAHGGAK